MTEIKSEPMNPIITVTATLPEVLCSEVRIDIEEEQDKNLCFNCFSIVCGCLCGCGFIALILCYYIYGIQFLIDDKSTNDVCNSNIWRYVLTSFIISFVFGGFGKLLGENKDVNSIYLFLIGGVEFGIGMWGVMLCQNENCEEMKESNLYEFAYYVSIVKLSMGCFLLLTSCIMFLKEE
jgi:hypothetical protein